MADFGNAGKITIRRNAAATQIDQAANESLHYKLTALGAEPEFAFSCQHRQILSSKTWSSPQMIYEWDLGKKPGDFDATDDVYVVAMSFARITKYTLQVEHRNQFGSVIEVLKDIDYESQDPNDSYNDSLRVFTA
ncbi:MAG TPA: hypothetical protein VGW33_11925 [Terriglobia bacterium]|nr:hypothetical protein [Terriglobia bacterium]